MRVLVWMGSFWPIVGGIEVHATKLLPALRERGYEFIIVASQNSPDLPREEQYGGIPVYRFPFWSAHNNIECTMEMQQEVARLKRDFAPDLIHRNSVGVGDFFHLATANAHPAPLLVTLHGKWLPQADALVAQTLRAADWIVGCSATILHKGQQLAPDIASRSSTIYNAVEEPGITPAPLPLTPPRLLCLGRMAAVKGFDLALSAMAMVVEHFPDACLVMAGDGPERPALEKQAAELGLKEAVAFMGWVAPENVPALINEATMMIMPSRFESFPVAALQAAQMARPVVGTRVGGLPEIVINERTGLLVEEENSTALATAITFLLNQPETAACMGQTARSRVRREFSWEKHVDAYDKLYRALIMSRRKNGSALIVPRNSN